jgi:hypothetical protein
MSSAISAKDVREVIPMGVPTDIATLVSSYIHPEIKTIAEKYYNKFLDDVGGEDLLPKDIFLDKIVTCFIMLVGSSFEDFLKGHKTLLIDSGIGCVHFLANAIFENLQLSKIYEIFPFIEFVYDSLEILGKKENYIKDGVDLESYTESLWL